MPYAKDIKCYMQWWQKNESVFPIIGFLAQQILRIVGSHIESKVFFSLASILTNLKKCCVQ
jgi:hypothetical protein